MGLSNRAPRKVEFLPPIVPHAPATTKDIAEVVHILHRQFAIPLEIVPDILDHAEYWARTTVERREHVRISQFTEKEEPYVSVRVDGRNRFPLRKVVFETVSSDQGSRSSDPDNETPSASWTWFEAGLEFEEDTAREQPRRRWIHTNAHGNGDATIQAKVWGGRDGDPEAAEWVDQVRVGDVVHVYAKAPYPGWVNYVDEVRVSVFCAWM